MSAHGSRDELIAEWLSGRRDELRDLIRSYVAIDTRSPNEHAAEPFLGSLMQSIGYELVPAGDWERGAVGILIGHHTRRPKRKTSRGSVVLGRNNQTMRDRRSWLTPTSTSFPQLPIKTLR